MLQLILGRSGSGKTTQVYERLQENAAKGRRSILLIPEQYSFESERILLNRLGSRKAPLVQVFSFTRLAQWVFDETGTQGGLRLDDAARMVLMSRALEQTADRLTLYQRHAGDIGCAQALLALLAECRRCRVSASLLAETAQQLPEGTLHRKLQDISLVFSAYDALLGQAYLDPLDDLDRLRERIPACEALQGIQVFTDGFKGFTAQEMAVLEALLCRAEQLTVTLCTDTMEPDSDKQAGIFSPIAQTAVRLREMAGRHGIAAASPVRLTGNHRTADPALQQLEACCFDPDPEPYDGSAAAVTKAVCRDVHEESIFVARTVRRLLREEGYRCRDIAVVARDLTQYRDVLEPALKRAGIPFYRDQRETILTEPLIVTVVTALHCVERTPETEELLRLMKAGMLTFSSHSVSLLENYAYIWDIRGRDWWQPFTGSPYGRERREEDAAKQLDYLNLLRQRLIHPLEQLRQDVQGHITGEAFAGAVYRYLRRVRADRMVRLWSGRLRRQEDETLAVRQERMWDLLMGLLDRFAATLGETRLTVSRLTELFVQMAGAVKVGDIPRGLDAVQIGTADRIRFSSPRAVFVLGANEGVFPADPQSSSLLSDGERSYLIGQGVPMADTVDLQLLEERFFAYAALSAPRERLYVSYVRTSDSGDTAAPSVIVEMLEKILPKHLCCKMDAEDVEAAEEAFAQAVSGEDGKLCGDLKAALSEDPLYRDRLERVSQALCRDPATFRDPAAARRFFGRDMQLSSSQMEQYYRCRFGYFCRYGLNVSAPRRVGLDRADFGTVAHYVMQHCLPEYVRDGWQTVTRDRVERDAALTVEAYLSDRVDSHLLQSGEFRQLVKRLKRLCAALLWRVAAELRDSEFVPVDYELSVGRPDPETGDMLPATALTLPDGSQIRVIGQIDRVDVFRQNGHAYVRVVDYKTSNAHAFKLSHVIEGINAQTVIYMLSLWDNGQPRYKGEVLPAGVLYLPAVLNRKAAFRQESASEREQKQFKAMKMSGLLLDDKDIVRAMEPEADGVFIPAKITKKGEFAAASTVASLEQLGQLKRKMETLLRTMAETLRRGDVAALPAKGDKDACQYCDYKAVCGWEPGDEARLIRSVPNDAVWAMLQQEEDGTA